MSVMLEDDTERAAWGQFAAAVLGEAGEESSHGDFRQKKAAAVADEMILHMRARCAQKDPDPYPGARGEKAAHHVLSELREKIVRAADVAHEAADKIRGEHGTTLYAAEADGKCQAYLIVVDAIDRLLGGHS